MDKVQDSIQSLIGIGNLVDESIYDLVVSLFYSSVENSVQDLVRELISFLVFASVDSSVRNRIKDSVERRYK